jgi:hypothetical protein
MGASPTMGNPGLSPDNLEGGMLGPLEGATHMWCDLEQVTYPILLSQLN